MSFMQFVMAIDRTGGSGSQARWGSLTETHRSSPFANNHLQSALVSYGLNMAKPTKMLQQEHPLSKHRRAQLRFGDGETW